MIRETRAVAIDQAEVRKDAETKSLNFTGHAAVFNERTWIGSARLGFYEEVDPGFFDDVLGDRAAFLVNHDPNILLARNGSTMSLSVDERGLVPDAQWDPNDPDAVKWAGRVERGDANEMSFAFTVDDNDPKSVRWSDAEDGKELRTLLKAKRLYDVSLVTYPAYEGTDGGLRSEDQAAEIVKRHLGFDPREAVRTSQPEVEAPEHPAEASSEPQATESDSPVTESGPSDSPADEQRGESLVALRHRALAALHRLPL